MSKKLHEAVDYVNSACGRPSHTPLLMIATCQFDGCAQEFPMLPQDHNRALEHGHPHICPECRPKYHRQQKKAKTKAKKAQIAAMA